MDFELWEHNREFGLPQVFVDQLEVLAKNVKDNRVDCLGLLVGGERLGKSTLQSRIALCLGTFLDTDVVLQRDYHYDLINYISDLLKAYRPVKGGQHLIKVYDEPVLGAHARKWNSDRNTLLNMTFATIGYKYLTMLASIPSFLMLDSMVREHRVAFLCKVHGYVGDDGMVQKGYFSLYNGAAVKKIYKDQKTRQTIWPSTKYKYLRFDSLEGTEFWNEYEVFSADSKQKVNEDLLEALVEVRKAGSKFSKKEEEAVKALVGGLE